MLKHKWDPILHKDRNTKFPFYMIIYSQIIYILINNYNQSYSFTNLYNKYRF